MTSTMSGPLLLPLPLDTGSLALGQLLVDPLHPDSSSFACSTAHPALNQPILQSRYQDVLSHDDKGRLLSSLSGTSLSSHQKVLLVQADKMSYASLKSPRAAFDALRRDAAAQSFLCKMALQHRPLYYVSGIQKLTNPSFTKAVVKEGSIAEAPNDGDSKIRLPTHVRRDSGINLEDEADDAIFAVDLRKVRCLVGTSDEPHTLEDIPYEWSYHKLDGPDGLQLSIGLGNVLDPAELRALAGIASNDDFTDDSYDVDSSDDEGLAGF